MDDIINSKRYEELFSGDTEQRCPQCLHILTDEEAVHFPNEFVCPYCLHRDKPIYVYTHPFMSFEKMDDETIEHLQFDCKTVEYLINEINKIAAKWGQYDYHDLQRTIQNIRGLGNSVEEFFRWYMMK